MKRFTLMAIAVSALVTTSTQAADNDKDNPTKNRRERAERREAKVDIDKRVREINKLDNS